MQLDHITVALRAREPWEAIDLGATMVRAWWRPIYGSWLVVVLPLTLAVHAVLPTHPLVALLILWWLKPLYDRVVLHVLSHSVFGSPPSVRESLRQLRVLLRTTGLGGALTWRRFDPVRSFNLPVRQLEQQQGKPARERERLLGRRAAGQATGLLYACITFEWILVLSLNLCADLLTPAGIPSTLTAESFFRDLLGLDDAVETAWLQNAIALVAISIVEPLYVASGFALYLNRRTALEAWDLELAFRRMDRPSSPAMRSLLALITGSLLSFGIATAPQPVWAANAATDSRKLIQEVLASPDFDEHKVQKVWRPRNPEKKEPSDLSLSGLMDFLTGMARALSELSRVVAFGVLAVAAFFIVRYLLKAAQNWRSNRPSDTSSSTSPPETVFGLDVRPDSLPANLAELAAQAAAQDPKIALSLLYRGALATLIHRDHLKIEAGDTEGDCMRRVHRMQTTGIADYFARLVAAWSQIAYARRAPDPQNVQMLCREWPQFFSPPVSGSR